ncbi:4'-phosphopantetheinyl transferase superfamily protein [Algiphilus sp. W345]|uniref:4'-phosphopantetheinyl transferase superfamily protein n=1 Tax=Banduia mediterranea TaxID=3075609 RepID=A0ABU2WNF7_9GAMM|nr:4'-phosphopantetheinyl transferase superfamily protein [Algiphilus sp. W345]MDT0498774.1 4'-phosphopantetheinyl transferase superfamily protein [Algiphilus sp. W345]
MPISLMIAEVFLPEKLQLEWLDALPEARRSQLLGWPDRRARQRSLIASRLLLEGLRRLGHPPDVLASLHYPARAKPRLPGLGLDFSISHCEGLVLCGLSASGPLGVDVEAPGSCTASVFRRYLSEAERAWAGDDPNRFARLWTRKEAIVKADGTGLAGLHRVVLDIDGRSAQLDGQTWHTAALEVGSQHIAHLARQTPEPPIPPESLSLSQLRAASP